MCPSHPGPAGGLRVVSKGEELRVQKAPKQPAGAAGGNTLPSSVPVCRAGDRAGWSPRLLRAPREGRLCLRGGFPGNSLALLLGEGQSCLLAGISQNSWERVQAGAEGPRCGAQLRSVSAKRGRSGETRVKSRVRSFLHLHARMSFQTFFLLCTGSYH